MDRDEVLKTLQKHVTKERYEHSLRVAEEAKKLAEIHGYDKNIAEKAALLHDIAKDYRTDQLKKLSEQYDLSEQLSNEPEVLWHGPIGAKIVKHEYNINNQDIYHAIYYHTTGRAKMSTLELIVYIADYIEPKRKIPDISDVKEKALEDLHEAVLLIISRTTTYLIGRQRPISPRTIFAYNDLLKYKKLF